MKILERNQEVTHQLREVYLFEDLENIQREIAARAFGISGNVMDQSEPDYDEDDGQTISRSSD
ncbi:MAG: hypothetical protein JWN28_731 [Candidatus Saccharibacteria bacterium]|nr:hypothetical protein [Candidatus Saccharibacteria bacterium]